MTIEVVSDVICPWCFIGKRRLEKALALLGESGAAVVWRPFELNPGMPPNGMARAEYRAAKFGSAERSRALEDHVREAGLSEGIDFQFHRIERTPNTFAAHRLIWLAEREGKQDAVVETLFRAYFLEAKDIGSADVLSRAAADCGIHMPEPQEGAAEVRALVEQSRARGIAGVPAFFRGGVWIASGAQPPEMLAGSLAGGSASGLVRM